MGQRLLYLPVGYLSHLVNETIQRSSDKLAYLMDREHFVHLQSMINKALSNVRCYPLSNCCTLSITDVRVS